MSAPKKKLTGNRNQCTECSEYFNSFTGFDRHRTGEFGKSRRCRMADELTLMGWRKNKDGFWTTETGRTKYRSKLARASETGVIFSNQGGNDTFQNKSLLSKSSQTTTSESCPTSDSTTAEGMT